MISLCMIVKNEASFIAECIQKASPFFDEIHIVDTGSTDDTLDILQKLDCDVYKIDWPNDFSKARNYSISKANNDWILILDADEYINNFDINAINDFINNKNNKYKIGKISIKSYYGESLANYSVNYLPRLFNKKYYKYLKPVHETLYPVDNKLKIPLNEVYVNIPIEVEHYGYLSYISYDKNKDQRNIELIENYLKTEFDPYLIQQLASNYHNLKRYEDAIKEIDKIIDNKNVQSMDFFSEIVYVKLVALNMQQRFEESLKLEKYFDLCKNNDKYLMQMANALRNTKNGEPALDIYQYLINKPDLTISISEPVYELAELMFDYGIYDEALKWYKKINVNKYISDKISICKENLK